MIKMDRNTIDTVDFIIFLLLSMINLCLAIRCLLYSTLDYRYVWACLHIAIASVTFIIACFVVVNTKKYKKIHRWM